MSVTVAIAAHGENTPAESRKATVQERQDSRRYFHFLECSHCTEIALSHHYTRGGEGVDSPACSDREPACHSKASQDFDKSVQLHSKAKASQRGNKEGIS